MKKTILFMILFAAFSGALQAQITDVYAGNDTVELRVGNYQYGFIQWQTSQDTVQWENIEGATDTIYRFLPTKNAYYRALAFFENCPDAVSRVCHVQVPPKADAGPDRKLMEGDGVTMFALLEEGCIGEWEIIYGQGGELSDVHDPNAYFTGIESEYKLKWTVTNACGSDSDTVAIFYHRTVLNDNIVVVDTTDILWSDSTQLINGIYYVLFSDPQPQINENSILIGVRENSFVRKIINHSEDNGIHCFETEEATLDDILLEGVLSFDVTSYLEEQGNKRFVKNRFPTRKELKEGKGDCIYIIMPEQDSTGQQISFNSREDGSSSLSWKIGKFKLPGDSYVTPTLTLTPNFVWELDRSGLNVHHFKFGLYNSSIITGKLIEIPGEVSFSISDKIIDLPIIPDLCIWVLIAGVPVEFTVNISAALKQTASYTIGPRMSFTEIQRTTLSSYIEYNEHFGWNFDFNLSKTNAYSLELPEYGDFSYELSIGPKFELLVYDVFGPFFSSKLYGKVKGRFGGSYNHATNLTFGLKPEIGAQLKFGEHVALEYSYSPDAKFFEVDDPFFMEVYSGNNQLYTPGEWLNEEVKVKVYNSRGKESGGTKVRFETSDGFLSSEYVTTGAFDGIAKVSWCPNPHSTGEITLRAYLYNLKNEPLQCVPVVIRAYQGTSSCANSTLSVRAELVNGCIQLVANGGKTPYVFSADGLSFSSTISPVTPVEGMTYHFYVRDDLNCVKDCYYTHPTFDCLTSDLTLTLSQQGNTVTAHAYGGAGGGGGGSWKESNATNDTSYEFCIDDGPYGSSNVFQCLTNGWHIVKVRDTDGCEAAEAINLVAHGGSASDDDGVTAATSTTVNVINNSTAVGGGSVTITGNASVVSKGICWSICHAPTTNDNYVLSTSSLNVFGDCRMTGLEPYVIYYMRVFAVTNTGTVYGNEVSFATAAVVPVISDRVVGITATSAKAWASVANSGGAPVTERGFCWGTSPNPTLGGTHIACGIGTGYYNYTLTGLTPQTPYYLRAYATNSAGTAYGEEVSFTTLSGGGPDTPEEFLISVTPNPAEGGTVTGAGTYAEDAECTLTAIASAGYIFSNWTENGIVVSTNAVYTFTVTGNQNLVANFAVSSGNDHAYVDLGLPSGTLWATCNVGANSPEEYGDYFAWGETTTKDHYDWSTYQYCNGNYNTLTKYCNKPNYGYNGFTDNLTTLLPEDDAVIANWGSAWRMPTYDEWEELCQNTTMTWTIQNGVNGMLFTANNGNNLFLPAAGINTYYGFEYTGSCGLYWSSLLDTNCPELARNLDFGSSQSFMNWCGRCTGFSVRAVRSSRQN